MPTPPGYVRAPPQSLHAVARIKLQDWLSFKLAPQPCVRLGKSWRLPGTGMQLRARCVPVGGRGCSLSPARICFHGQQNM
jgi:hypothetical protein